MYWIIVSGSHQNKDILIIQVATLCIDQRTFKDYSQWRHDFEVSLGCHVTDKFKSLMFFMASAWVWHDTSW